MQILKSRVQEEVSKGGKSKEIAERLGINLKQLQGAAEAFGINLRKKPTSLVEFVDDTKNSIEETVNNLPPMNAEEIAEDCKITTTTLDQEGNVEDLNEQIVESSKDIQSKQVVKEFEDKGKVEIKPVEDEKW